MPFFISNFNWQLLHLFSYFSLSLWMSWHIKWATIYSYSQSSMKFAEHCVLLDKLKSVYKTQKPIICQTSKLNPNIKPKCALFHLFIDNLRLCHTHSHSGAHTLTHTHTDSLNIEHILSRQTHHEQFLRVFRRFGASSADLLLLDWHIWWHRSGANNKKCDLTLMDDKCEAAAFWSQR